MYLFSPAAMLDFIRAHEGKVGVDDARSIEIFTKVKKICPTLF